MSATPILKPTLSAIFEDWKTWIQKTPPNPVGPPTVENVVAFKLIAVSFEDCVYACGILSGCSVTHSVLSGLSSLGEDQTGWEANSGWIGNPFYYPGFATQLETTAKLVMVNVSPAINININFVFPPGPVSTNVNVNLLEWEGEAEGKYPYGIGSLSGGRTDLHGKVWGYFLKSTFMPGVLIGG